MKNDRDESIARLLPGALNARAAAEPGEACLDVETLAAWADDTLDRDERRGAEQHAAGCARCQAMLAAMVRTAPAPIATPSVWRLPALGWLIPATAAAAALVVWTVVPAQAPGTRSDNSAATAQAAPAAAADKPTPRDVDADSQRLFSASAPAPRGASGIAARGDRAAAAPPPENRALAGKEAKQEERALQKHAPDAPAAPSANALTDATTRMREASPAMPLSAAAPARSPAVASPLPSASAAKTFALAAGAPATAIVSSSPGSQWRIVPGGAVEHTTDGGSTWAMQQTGAPVTLAAGASPSPSVCWLVGPNGVVLLSTDGRSWRRVAFPESGNLLAVTAADDKTATVTLADGRTLSTTDGGITWR